MNPQVAKVIKYSIAILFPVVISLPFAIIFNYYTILEASFLGFGALELLFAMLRLRSRDKANYKKNKSLYEDRTNDNYRAFRKEQTVIFILGGINIIFALITGLLIAFIK